MLSRDRITLRNVVLTAAVAMSGAVIAGTVWLGGHKNVPTASTTVTSSDDSVGGSASATPPSTTTITSNTYNITVNRPEGSSTSGATGGTTADTTQQDAPRAGSAPAAVQVRGAPVVVAPATRAPVQQQQAPAVQAPAAQANNNDQVPVVIPVPVGRGAAANYGNTGTVAPATRANDTVPGPAAVTPGATQVVPGAIPPGNVPTTPTGTPAPAAPPATGTPVPAPAAPTPQTGLGTGFSQGAAPGAPAGR